MESKTIYELMPHPKKVICRLAKVMQEKKYLQRLLKINRDQAIDRVKDKSKLLPEETAELIPHAGEIMSRINQIEREIRYLKRFQKIIKDMVREGFDWEKIREA